MHYNVVFTKYVCVFEYNGFPTCTKLFLIFLLYSCSFLWPNRSASLIICLSGIHFSRIILDILLDIKKFLLNYQTVTCAIPLFVHHTLLHTCKFILYDIICLHILLHPCDQKFLKRNASILPLLACLFPRTVSCK